MNDRQRANHIRKCINRCVREDLAEARKLLNEARATQDNETKLHFMHVAISYLMQAHANRLGTHPSK